MSRPLNPDALPDLLMASKRAHAFLLTLNLSRFSEGFADVASYARDELQAAIKKAEEPVKVCGVCGNEFHPLTCNRPNNDISDGMDP